MIDKLLKFLMVCSWVFFGIAVNNAYSAVSGWQLDADGYRGTLYSSPEAAAAFVIADGSFPMDPQAQSYWEIQGECSYFTSTWASCKVQSPWPEDGSGPYNYVYSFYIQCNNFYDPVTGQCTNDDPNDSCDVGETKEIFVDVFTLEQGNMHSDGKCNYNPDASTAKACGEYNGVLGCLVDAYVTGENAGSGVAQSFAELDVPPLGDDLLMDVIADVDTTTSVTNQTSTDPVTNATIDTEVVTESTIQSPSRTITQDSSGNIVIVENGQVISSVTTTTTTTTQTDGSYTVTESVSYDQDDQTQSTTIISGGSGTKTESTIPGATSNTYITNNYNSSGELTGSDSGSSGTGTNDDGTGEETAFDPGEVPGDVANGIEIATTGEGYFNSIASAPVVAAISDLGQSFPSSGVCPPIEFDTAITGFVSSDFHCQLYTDIEPVLSLVMKAVWVLLGIVIIFGA